MIFVDIGNVKRNVTNSRFNSETQKDDLNPSSFVSRAVFTFNDPYSDVHCAMFPLDVYGHNLGSRRLHIYTHLYSVLLPFLTIDFSSVSNTQTIIHRTTLYCHASNVNKVI